MYITAPAQGDESRRLTKRSAVLLCLIIKQWEVKWNAE